MGSADKRKEPQIPQENTPVDILSIRIDPSEPFEQRMAHYLALIENPYCFSCGELLITLKFETNGDPLEDVLVRYFKNYLDCDLADTELVKRNK